MVFIVPPLAVSNWHLQEEQDVQNTKYSLITPDNTRIYNSRQHWNVKITSTRTGTKYEVARKTNF